MNMRILVAAVLSLTSIGCGPDDANNGHTDSNNGHSHSNNGTTGADIDEYVDGLMKAGVGSTYEFTLVRAEPGPPDVGDNTWTIRITDTAGEPIEDATVVVKPFMPAHGHGTTPTEFTVAATGDGTYVVGPFDLFMPGVWEVDVAATGADAEDSVKFSFHLEG